MGDASNKVILWYENKDHFCYSILFLPDNTKAMRSTDQLTFMLSNRYVGRFSR